MVDSAVHTLTPALLGCGIVLRVQEDVCQILRAGQLCSVRYAKPFPSPRTEKVSPGHLVAAAAAADGVETVVWRWYDAVVLGEETGLVRLWEPSRAMARAEDAEVELDEVDRFYTEHGLWAGLD
jgi:hypothetical protein